MDKNNIHRLTIVTGDDSFAMDSARGDYLRRVRAALGEGCAVRTFDFDGEKFSDFVTSALTVSMFDEARVFMVLRAQELSGGDLALLDGAVEREIPGVYMYVSAAIDKRGGAKGAKTARAAKPKKGAAVSLRDIISKHGADRSVLIENYDRPRDFELYKSVMELAPRFFNRRISKGDAEYLAEIVEYDLIYSELQKIDLVLPPGAPIDKQVIDDVLGVTRMMSVFELSKALRRRDLAGALKVVDSLFAGKFEAASAVAAIFRDFWAMLKIKKFLENRPAVARSFQSRGQAQIDAGFEIGLAGGLLAEKDMGTEKGKSKVWAAVIFDGIVNHAAGYSERALTDIIGMLQRFDVDSKTGGADVTEPLDMQMLCYKIVRAA